MLSRLFRRRPVTITVQRRSISDAEAVAAINRGEIAPYEAPLALIREQIRRRNEATK